VEKLWQPSLCGRRADIYWPITNQGSAYDIMAATLRRPAWVPEPTHTHGIGGVASAFHNDWEAPQQRSDTRLQAIDAGLKPPLQGNQS